jgi:hypothetical protein
MYSPQDIRQSTDSSLTREESLKGFYRSLSADQKITIDKRQYYKLVNLLKSASALNLENKSPFAKATKVECLDEEIQTEEVFFRTEDFKEDQTEQIELLKFENKTHIENLKLLNDDKRDLLEQINYLKIQIKRFEENNEKNLSEINSLKSDLAEKDEIIIKQICEIQSLEKQNKKLNKLTRHINVDENIKVEENVEIENIKMTSYLLDNKVKDL